MSSSSASKTRRCSSFDVASLAICCLCILQKRSWEEGPIVNTVELLLEPATDKMTTVPGGRRVGTVAGSGPDILSSVELLLDGAS